jgi:branched-chain amino acid transport system substrate-binding protein
LSKTSGVRVVAGAMVLALSGALLFGCGGAKDPAKSDPAPPVAAAKPPIKIGAVLLQSGANAGYGIAQRAGVELAVDEINKAGGINGAPIQVIYEDSKGSKDEAITSARKLIDKDEVTAIIGPTLSGEMFGAGPVANEAGVPILGISTTANGITDIGKYVFRNSLPEALVLPQTVKIAVTTQKLKNVAVLWDAKDDFSVSGYKTFKEELLKNGVNIVAEASFQTKDQDFGPQITRVLAAKPDALIVSSLYQEGALLMVQARKVGFKGAIVGGNGFNSPKLAEIAQAAAEGTIVGSPWFAGRDDAKVKKFVADYTAKTGGRAPDQFAAQAYDGAYLIAQALKVGGSNRDKVRDALAAIKNYEGVTGTFSFDQNRNPVMQPFVLQIKDGKYSELK